MGNVDEIRIFDDGVQLQFFSQWQSLNFPRVDSGEIAFLDYKNIDPFIGSLISSGKATLKELKESYSLEDAYILWEVITVTKYNEFLAIEEANKANR